MKNSFAKSFVVCALAGVLGFALSACDDSSSAGGDETETSALSCSAEMSSSSRHCEDCKDEAISSDSKSNDPAEVSSSSVKETKNSSDSKSSSSVKSGDSSSSEGDESDNGSIYDATTNTLTDLRDGQTYKTVKIGNQWWMAENLNYETDDSYCYDNEPSNCTKYGRLYTWAAVMDSAGTWSTNGKGCGYGKTCSPTYPVRGVCPTGWHLPTTGEFETLFDAVGGQSTAAKMLKSTTGWNNDGNGTDAYGFSALPAGHRIDVGLFYNSGLHAHFWSATGNGSYYAYYMYLDYGNDDARLLDNNYKYSARSVRCLKDSD